ncbi:hypothetical protein VPH35_034204 [Triticum aestivum]
MACPSPPRGAYEALGSQLTDPCMDSIWSSRVPSRVGVFGWLFYLDQLNTRANLHRKTLVDSSTCARFSAAVQDRAHFLGCTSSCVVWDALGFQPTYSLISSLWTALNTTGLS